MAEEVPIEDEEEQPVPEDDGMGGQERPQPSSLGFQQKKEDVRGHHGSQEGDSFEAYRSSAACSSGYGKFEHQEHQEADPKAETRARKSRTSTKTIGSSSSIKFGVMCGKGGPGM